MEAKLRNLVRTRAKDCCEYCHLPQAFERFHPFHVEHIVARRHGGGDDLGNLALACLLCNTSKGTNLAGIDPDSGELCRLFHPRTDRWEDHFESVGALVAGKTALGRTTAWLLRFNSDARVELRRVMIELGEWP